MDSISFSSDLLDNAKCHAAKTFLLLSGFYSGSGTAHETKVNVSKSKRKRWEICLGSNNL